MDRFAAMLLLLGLLVSMVLMLLALFAVAPIICSCLVSLLYSLYLFMAYEEAGVHRAQEFENRFWTVFAVLLSTALFFAKDSPLAFGRWSPTLGFLCVVLSGYAMHLWDRHLHRIAISQSGGRHLRRTSTTSQSLLRLQDLGIPVSAQVEKINECLTQIDQLLIPSTINNLINQRYVMSKEREIIKIIGDCDARALNYLISHVKLGLLFYKIKDHRSFNGKNRTELINLLAIERLQILTVISRVILLHSLQLMKIRANKRAEYWVQNILLNTHQDDLSELKTLMDTKGDYFSMNKLIYDDIHSESVRLTILSHFRREAAVQQTYEQMGTRRKNRVRMQFRKVLSDVDDTLCCSGGRYPAGVDKRFTKKTVYPGVLAFYRELDLGIEGPDEWEDDQVGNLVFLSARPHVYRDMSEKHNFAKFELLRANTLDGRKGMHTMPSLLSGDLTSGSQYVMTNDFEPLALKKVDNFRRYASIYPEYKHVFVCDNGQGDVRAGEIMYENFPYELEAVYVHIVQEVQNTYGFDPERWKHKEFKPVFFRTYPEAALHAAKQNPPLIRIKGLQRICQDAVKDFIQLKKTNFASELSKEERRLELNQAIWEANEFLVWRMEEPVAMIPAEQKWKDGEKVRTPYGIATIHGFDPVYNLYDVEIDWRPLDVQVKEFAEEAQVKIAAIQPRESSKQKTQVLPTVIETEDEYVALGGEEEMVVTQALRNIEEGRTNISGEQQVGESSAEVSVHTLRSNASAKPVQSSLTQTSNKRLTDASPTSSDLTNGKETAEAILDIKEASEFKSTMVVRARVSGRHISKYVPPILPVLDTKRKTFIFPFLTKTSESPKAAVAFKKGDEVSTLYGPATVIDVRPQQKVVVVKMIGWNGTGFLQQDTCKRISKSLFSTLLRQFGGSEPVQKQLPFPHAVGTTIITPFGEAKVEKPIPPKYSAKIPPDATIGLSLQSWKLANGSHPILYCTVPTAKLWKERKREDGSAIFSALNTIVTSASRTLLEPFLPLKKSTTEEPKKFKRYFLDAAAVSTKYGDGRVISFRETDGIYEVSLVSWNLADGSNPKAYLRQDDITYRTARGCREDYPVLTNLGLSGTLASVVPTTGVHIVTIQSAGMVCYLQPESVVRPLKAAVGEEVLTPFGEGKVKNYDIDKEMYTITLGWNALLYAKGDKFDRVVDGVQDRDVGFGIDWFFRYLFFRSDVPRSRSNSVVSATQSTRSGT